MGVFEGITHSEEIKELLNDAQTIYNDANNRLENQKTKTTKSLEELGRIKVNAWSKDMNTFLDSFGSFNNVEMVCKNDESYDFLGKHETPNDLMLNMKTATYNANEIIKAGALAAGTGVLVGIATYGAVSMFAKASTGTAISTLNGIAKKNATLAWLGGGSLASGGSGIAGGKVVLGGVVIGAVALVGGIIAGAKGKAKLAEAKKIHAEAEAAVSKMNVAITGMEGIERVSDNYRQFISDLSKLFNPYLKEMKSIAQKYERGSDGKVDFNSLSEMEQKTLHISWLLAQLYYHILSVPILTEQGEVDPSARQLLQKAKQNYTLLSGQASQLENEKKTIKELLSEAKSVYKGDVKKFYDQKQSTCNALVNNGKKRTEFWEKSFSPFLEGLSHFENISVNNVYQYNVTDIPIEFIFERCDSVLQCINRLKTNGIKTFGNTGYVEVALFGGEDFLSELAQIEDEKKSAEKAHRHDMSLWFTGKLDSAIANNIAFGGVSDNYIEVVKQTVKGISGRENLAQATEINQQVKELSNKINTAISDFGATINKIRNIEAALKKYDRVQSLFLAEIDRIKNQHQTSANVVQYDLLSEAEKRVFEMSFIIAKIQYTILASCTLQETNGGDIDDSDLVIASANKIYKTIKKDSFKMNNDNDTAIVNVIWKDNADKALIAGFVTSAICIVLSVVIAVSGNLLGLIGLLGAAIAFPIYFYFKNLNQSKLFLWRSIRIVAAIVVIVDVAIIGLVV